MPQSPIRASKVPLPHPPAPRRAAGPAELRLRRLADIAADAIISLAGRLRPRPPWTSQCGQDRFVVEKIFRRKRGGFFLEIGGGDGLYLSNTLVLERYFDWSGVLVEPTGAFAALAGNRPAATCVNTAIAAIRKTVRLTEIADEGQIAIHPEAARGNALLSVVQDAAAADALPQPPFYGRVGNTSFVEAITLADLLTQTKAPQIIDYFSFDVEGAELEILQPFPFDRWRFNCIGIETPSAALHDLLAGNGYLLIREGQPLDWFYLHRDFVEDWFRTMN